MGIVIILLFSRGPGGKKWIATMLLFGGFELFSGSKCKANDLHTEFDVGLLFLRIPGYFAYRLIKNGLRSARASDEGGNDHLLSLEVFSEF